MSNEKVLSDIAEGVAALRTKTEQNETASVELKSFVTEELAKLREERAEANAPRMDAQDFKEKAEATFAQFATKGFDFRNADHVKAASESNFTVMQNGGFAIPKTMMPDIGTLLRKRSPVRQLARSISGHMGYVHLAKDGAGVASKRNEAGAVGAGEASTYNELTFGSTEFYMNVPVSVWTLDGDAQGVIDFAAEARADIIAGLAALEGEQHLLGDETNTIKAGATPTSSQIKTGLLKLAVEANANRFTNVIGKLGGVQSAANKVITFDDLIRLQGSLHTDYAANANYLFSPETEVSLMILKDGNGNYVWSQNQTVSGQPASIRGKGYAVTDHMVDIAAAANSEIGVIYGDFSKYVIVDQAPITWVIDPVTDLRRVKFHARMRQGSCLTDFQALRVLTNKPSA